jgi:ABC-type transport system substrate-binding protein
MEETYLKNKILNPKFEILNKSKILISKSNKCLKLLNFEIINCLGFRVSYFGFLCCAIMLLLSGSSAFATGYDGVWFLGFNLHKDVFNNINVRKAIGRAIDRKYIATQIMSGEVVPNGFIPKGMAGYSAKIHDQEYNPEKAKPYLKDVFTLTLLHTDGVKTIKIAKLIKKNLAAVGVNVNLKQVAYQDQTRWEKELQSGKDHLFLMGYKSANLDNLYIGNRISRIFHAPGCAGIPSPDDQVIFETYEEATSAGYSPDPACNPHPAKKTDTYDLLNPLFHSGGEANFTFFTSSRVDGLLDQVSEIDMALSNLRAEKFREINRIISNEIPGIPLFYITKL